MNTAVTFLKARGDKIFVTLPGGQELMIHNVKDFSGEELDGIFTRTFSTSKVDLSQFTEEEREAITDGKVIPGMRKKAVLVALGYPPKHKTASLEVSEWRYWSSRFGTFLVRFQGGVVSDIKS